MPSATMVGFNRHGAPSGRRKRTTRFRRSWATLAIAAASALLYSASLASAIGTGGNEVGAVTQKTETFTESLTIRPLVDGRVHTFAEFEIKSHVNSQASNASSYGERSTPDGHFRLLPRSFIQIARATGLQDFTLALNRGTWDYTTWGSPVWWDEERQEIRGQDAVGAGAEIIATIEKSHRGFQDSAIRGGVDSVLKAAEAAVSNYTGVATRSDAVVGHISSDVLGRWKTLNALLAGIFCASLDAADERVVVRPLLSSLKSRINAATRKTNAQTLYAALPAENICTENLTPLLKMLPCKSSAGLAQLLSPHAVFDSDFHGLSVHVSRDGDDAWVVKFTFQAVFSAMLDREGRKVGKRDWSLGSLFQRDIHRACPLASQSKITVHRPQSSDPSKVPEHRLSPRPFNWEAPAPETSREAEEDEDEDTEARVEKALSAEGIWARNEEMFASILSRQSTFTYDAKSLQQYSSGILNVGMQFWPLDENFKFPQWNELPAPPSLTASRSVVGAGQEAGEVVLRIRNNDRFLEREVLYTESLPWLLKPYLHTMRISVDADDMEEKTSDGEPRRVYYADELESPFLLSMAHQPPQPRTKSFLLEAHLRIPPASALTLRFDVAKSFLRYTEHLPDAHRGFDLPAAVITPLPTSERDLQPKAKLQLSRIYTQPALLEVAVPDFSMPYNVIIMTSTIIALFFGSVFNNLTRKYQDVTLVET